MDWSCINEIIEVKKSTQAVKIDQLKKYIDNSHSNFFNKDNRNVILYIDEQINPSLDSVKKIINFCEENGIKMANSLDELKGVLK